MRDGDHGGEVVVDGRVEVEHQVSGSVDVVGKPECRVVFDGALVGEPQQRPPVVAQRVVHLALGGLGPHRHGAHPVRRVFRHVLLHEGGLAAQHPQHGQGTADEAGQNPVGHRVQVVDQVALRGAGVGAQWLVEVGQVDPVALLAVGAHELTIGPTTRPRPADCDDV